MKNSLLVAVALLFVLAGCGPDSAVESESAQQNSSAEAADFVLYVSGAETLEFDSDPRFGCVDGQIFIQTITQSPKLMIYLPADIEPGSYALAQYDANASPIYVDNRAVVGFTGAIVRGSGSSYGNFYFKPVAGELEIEHIPRSQGEYLTARLDAQLANHDDLVVELQADLNIEDTGFMTSDCHR